MASSENYEEYEEELSPLNKEELELSELEEEALEECLDSFEPVSTSEYINLIASIVDKDLGK